jgi:heme-degrading monooxygenase HmoA
VVIFSSRRPTGSRAVDDGYAEAAVDMEERSRRQAGFLGLDSVRGDDGEGITVCYWDSEEAVDAWRQVEEHQAAQSEGRSRWYESYEVVVAKVVRSSSLDRG